jgi:UDP-N-acetylglucosamine--N-acetylmuramyl-(pentapeptide) pyrophosphoryl-undecaprenol N-acetylglucosamine transferase
VAPDSKCVLVTGGSLGATSINLAALKAFEKSDFEVIHLAGERDLPSLSAPRDGYHLFGYVDDFADAVLASDLAVARAGGSVFELAAGGCPAILIPYPQAAGDHQTGNARWMESAGAAKVLLDQDLNPARLHELVEKILGNDELLGSMAAASKALARPNAAALVAAEVTQAGGGV